MKTLIRTLMASSLLAFTLPANASTYTLPINTEGTFFIGGSILNPTPISVSISVDAVLPINQYSYFPDAVWNVGLEAWTVNQETHFIYSNYFFADGARNGPGYPLHFVWGFLEVTDDVRELRLDAHVSGINVAPFNYQITITLPDDLVVTPLPAALPLFITGLGVLLIHRIRRRNSFC
jgi:hypothetical protein